MTRRSRSVLVTGAARGLGSAVVERLRADGYEVLATDLHESPGTVSLDVREPQQWAVAAGALVELGDPWGLVNCAARTVVCDLFSIEVEEWDDVLATNLRGPFLGIRTVGPLLRERCGGRIVSIASDSAFRGIGITGAHYAASKAGLITLTRRAAAALAGSGVTANAVAPTTGSKGWPPMSRWAGSAGWPRSRAPSRGSCRTMRPTSPARRFSSTAAPASSASNGFRLSRDTSNGFRLSRDRRRA